MKFLYLDTETTGLEAGKHGIWQIAWIYEKDGKELDRRSFYMNPKCEIDWLGMEKCGNQWIAKEIESWEPQYRVWNKVCGLWESYVDKYDRNDKMYLVGQNVGFDYEFLKEWFILNGSTYINSYIYYHKIDLMSISMFLKMTGLIKPENGLNLESVAKMLQLDFKGDAHDAMTDVIMVRDVLIKYEDIIHSRILSDLSVSGKLLLASQPTMDELKCHGKDSQEN